MSDQRPDLPGYHETRTGEQLTAALVKAESATQPGDQIPVADINLDGGTDIGADLADADLILVDDGASGTNRKSALSRIWAYIQTKLAGLFLRIDKQDLGDVTNATLTLVQGTHTVRTARLTGSGTLTIVAAGAAEDATAEFICTSDGDGTREIALAIDGGGDISWLGYEMDIKPLTGWTIFLYVRSTNGVVHVSANYSKVPA